MYLLFESYYGEIILDCGDSTNIIGLYETKEQALKKAQELIKEDTEKNNYVLDNEIDTENDNYFLLFYNNIENWSCYYEIFIKKLDLIKEEK